MGTKKAVGSSDHNRNRRSFGVFFDMTSGYSGYQAGKWTTKLATLLSAMSSLQLRVTKDIPWRERVDSLVTRTGTMECDVMTGRR